MQDDPHSQTDQSELDKRIRAEVTRLANNLYVAPTRYEIDALEVVLREGVNISFADDGRANLTA